jgi:hypothetical protein
MGRAILLPLLAWHVTGQPACIFKNVCNNNMATIQNMFGQDCTIPGCHVVWVTKFCIVVPNEIHIKKRSRITFCTQLYLTCKNSYMF